MRCSIVGNNTTIDTLEASSITINMLKEELFLIKVDNFLRHLIYCFLGLMYETGQPYSHTVVRLCSDLVKGFKI